MSAIALGLAVLAFAGLHPSPASGQAAAGWVTLFDGSNLNAFDRVGTANWTLADGVVEATSGSGFLVTKASYGDFELRVEFWVDADANSGIFIRCADPQKITAENSYEVNIFDKRPDPTYRTGAIVNVAKPSSTIDAGGRWNTFEITARGPRLTVTLNGTRTVDVEHKGFAKGPIALQYGAGTVRFRNVQIRPLD